MKRTPVEWIVAWAGLHCLSCGKLIGGRSGEFQEVMNGNSYLDHHVPLHNCKIEKIIPTQEVLDAAAERMKEVRNRVPLTFEQECKVYNDILYNQTYHQ